MRVACILRVGACVLLVVCCSLVDNWLCWLILDGVLFVGCVRADWLVRVC